MNLRNEKAVYTGARSVTVAGGNDRSVFNLCTHLEPVL